MTKPILMPRELEELKVVCDACATEHGAWTSGASLEEVYFTARLPLDQDEATVECERGHRQLVVREGTERAANFGLG